MQADDGYQALIGRIEQRLASRSRDAKRGGKTSEAKNDSFSSGNYQVSVKSREKNTATFEHKDSMSFEPYNSMEHTRELRPNRSFPRGGLDPFQNEPELYQTRQRLIEQERRVKEETDVGSLINCIMPLVMEQVKSYLASFKRDLVAEIKKEVGRSLATVASETTEECSKVKNMVLHHKHEIQTTLEKILSKTVTRAEYTKDKENEDIAPLWNNSILSRNLALDADRHLDLVHPKELMRKLKLKSGRGIDTQPSQPSISQLNRSLNTRLPFAEVEIYDARRPVRPLAKPKSRSTSVDGKNSPLNKTGSTKNTYESREKSRRAGKPSK